MSIGTSYPDFPDCLPRYAWLIAEAQRDHSRLFHGRGDCKACGERIGENAADQRTHVREHVRQLKQNAKQRQQEGADRLRRINQLRKEGKR